MSYSRSAKTFLNVILTPHYMLPLAGAAISFSAATLFNQRPDKGVVMRPTRHRDESSLTTSILPRLMRCLGRDADTPAIFIALLRRQPLTDQQAIEMAKLAVQHAHALELEALVKQHPILTRKMITDLLLTTQNPHTFRELLQANADKKLKHLSYLFNPLEPVTIVEEDDMKARLAAMSMTPNQKKTIILVNSEYYDPSINIQVLPQRIINYHGLVMFARRKLMEREQVNGSGKLNDSMVLKHT